jgi:hypothetical protein
MSKKSATVTLSVEELNDLYYELNSSILEYDRIGRGVSSTSTYFVKQYNRLVSLKKKVGIALDSIVIKS